MPARKPRPKPHAPIGRPPLSPSDHRFIEAFAECRDWTEAARRAGLPPETGRELMLRNDLLVSIEVRLKHPTREQINLAYVKDCWSRLHHADARKLIEKWSVACRHCYGLDHRYQFEDTELQEYMHIYRIAFEAGAAQDSYPDIKVGNALVSAQISTAYLVGKRAGEEPPPFDDLGGGGYTINREPMRGPDYVAFLSLMAERQGLFSAVQANADHTCPSCHGHGMDHVVIHDTRTYDDDARALYRGIKVTANGGIEVLMRDQDRALEHLGRIIGAYNDRKPIEEFDPEKLTDEQLDIVSTAIEQRIASDAGDAAALLEHSPEGETEPA